MLILYIKKIIRFYGFKQSLAAQYEHQCWAVTHYSTHRAEADLKKQRANTEFIMMEVHVTQPDSVDL